MKYKFLPQEALKLMACVLMLLDHIGHVNFFPVLSTELRVIGRLAFPIFCFLLCEGFSHTRSKKNYIIRLAIGAILAEIPFDLMCYGHLTWARQSVMLTLLIAFGMALLMEKMPHPAWKVALLIPACVLAQLLNTDYGGTGVLMVAIFLLTGDLGKWKLPVQTVLLLIAQLLLDSWRLTLFGFKVPIQVFAVFAMVPIALYSGKKMSRSPVLQWAFYLFYPLHMAVLALFR